MKTMLSKEAERHKPLTATDRLRETLDELERQIGVLGRSSPEEVRRIPSLLDEATVQLTELKGKGGDFLAEEVRLQSLYARLERKAAAFLNAAGGAPALAAIRPVDVPESHWWWHIERIVAEQRRAWLKQVLRIAAIVVAVVIVAAIIYQAFLAPDPAVRERALRIDAAGALAEQGDYAGAIQEIQVAQTAVPDDPYLLIMEGAYYEQLGQTESAEQAFGAAKRLAEDESNFLIMRAEVYLRTFQPARALEDLRVVLAREPEKAVAYYLQGVAYQNTGRLQEAVTSFQLAADYASAAGDTQLEGMSRVQISYLLQQMVVPALTTPTPTS